MLCLFLKPARRPSLSGPAAAVTGALMVVLLVVGCASPSAVSPVGSAIPGAIRVTASEYRFDPATLTRPSGSTTFELVNSGATEHEFQVLKGGTVVGAIKPVAPGKTGDVTVDLTAGDYTFACKIAGHDALGMKGTFSVTGG